MKVCYYISLCIFKWVYRNLGLFLVRYTVYTCLSCRLHHCWHPVKKCVLKLLILPQLQVTQVSKGKKAQEKEYFNLCPPKEQPPAARVGAGGSPCHLDVDLNSSPHLLPLLQQRVQDAIISLASLHACAHLGPMSDAELAFLSAYKQTNPGKSSHMSYQGVHTQVNHQNLERGPEQWQR